VGTGVSPTAILLVTKIVEVNPSVGYSAGSPTPSIDINLVRVMRIAGGLRGGASTDEKTVRQGGKGYSIGGFVRV